MTALDRRQLVFGAMTLGLVAPSASAPTVVMVAEEAPPASPVAAPGASAAATPGATPAPAITVTMTDQLRFQPEAVTIKRGETIVWINRSAIPHTATDDPEKNPLGETRPELALLPAGAEPWDSRLLQQGQSFAYTFTVAGEYRYFCIPHILSGMLGSITVQD